MIGAIIGDIAGSRFEFHNTSKTDFVLFHKDCHVTDDSIMTLAIADALLQAKAAHTLGSHTNVEQLAISAMRKWGRQYPHMPYGDRFKKWLKNTNPVPYNSYGNGGAMRVCAVGWVASNEAQALELAEAVTRPTHGSQEGVLAAQVVALAIYYARCGYSKEKIADTLYGPPYADGYLTALVDYYSHPEKHNIAVCIPLLPAPFDMTASHAVDVATRVFFASNSFEDTIRQAIAAGGDSDTIACIAGAMAEAYYGVPKELSEKAKSYLDRDMLALLESFSAAYPQRPKQRR